MRITTQEPAGTSQAESRRRELLKRTELFEGFDEEELAAIAGLMRPRHYRRGMYVFLEGEPVEAVYFVESGSVKAFTTDAEGREHILSILGPGDFFPHVGFLDGGPAPGTAQALEEAALWVVERREFYRLLTERPGLAVRMVAVLSGRIRRLQAQVRELATRSVHQRVAEALLRLADQHGTPHPLPGAPRAVWLAIRLSHQELAGLVGTARETVSRSLSELRRAGLLATERGHLVLVDPERLKHWG